MKAFPRVSLPVLALLFGATVSADEITFDYFAIIDECPIVDNSPCGDAVNVGDTIEGFVVVDFNVDGTAGAADVLDFLFDVNDGVFVLSEANGQSVADSTSLMYADGVISGLFELFLPGLGGPLDGILSDIISETEPNQGVWNTSLLIPTPDGPVRAFVNGGRSFWTERPAEVPEPGMLALILAGLVGFAVRRRLSG